MYLPPTLFIAGTSTGGLVAPMSLPDIVRVVANRAEIQMTRTRSPFCNAKNAKF
jgi:hypothetical protein